MDREIQGDINHRNQAEWMKQRNTSSVICDQMVLLKLKVKFYYTANKPATLHGMECWVVKYQQEDKICVVEIRMLCQISGHVRKYKTRNEYIKEKIGVPTQ